MIRVPGRVNLMGEHIDYLGYTVLPMAITRSVGFAFHRRTDHVIRISSAAYGTREFIWTDAVPPYPQGDFGNYLKAAAQTVGNRWGRGDGLNGVITSSIPAAAGLSSSSALFIAVVLALLEARGIDADFGTLMEILPEGETYVGTRGGGMDHAACLAGRPGCALRIDFHPTKVTPIPIPPEWSFFVAHSLERAEKSGAARDKYNLRRVLAQEGDPAALRHGLSERVRVQRAIEAMMTNDIEEFGSLLSQSHRSLRDDLQVSCEPADRLADACLRAGAKGARIMGAGFGGYVVALGERRGVEEVLARLERDHYAHGSGLESFPDYLMQVEAGKGALSDGNR